MNLCSPYSPSACFCVFFHLECWFIINNVRNILLRIPNGSLLRLDLSLTVHREVAFTPGSGLPAHLDAGVHCSIIKCWNACTTCNVCCIPLPGHCDLLFKPHERFAQEYEQTTEYTNCHGPCCTIIIMFYLLKDALGRDIAL